MKFKFNVSDEFKVGIERLRGILGFEDGEDITVMAEMSDFSGVSLKGNGATIYYRKKHQFWRQLSTLVYKAKSGEDFEVIDDGHFETLGIMICVSRGMVPRVDTLKRFIDYLAVMGYNLIMLQTDDLFEIKERPYFGYMRGRYTECELREFDEYAYEYGIEAIPCIECYSHMRTYLLWSEAARIKDTASVLLAREDATFEFVEEMIRTVSGCFRSKRIHIGMDEAWDMGRGRFLDRHGYVPRFQIFNEFMERLIGITDKLRLKPMMWSDMYFRVCNENDLYYDPEIVISDEVIGKIPEGVELIFWHYGENYGCDNALLEKHKTLGREIIFSGGLWDWTGHFPENSFAYKTTSESVRACRQNNVRQMMTTTWFIDSECDMFATLLGLSNTAELAYSKEPTEASRRERFEAATGGSFDAFSLMTKYHNNNRTIDKGAPDELFLGKHLFWQDIMEGLYDTHLFCEPMSDHYRGALEGIKRYRGCDRWDYLYEYCEAVFEYLTVKCRIAEKLYPSYKSGDRNELKNICEELLPKLRVLINRVHNIHRDIWSKYNKDFGFVNNDIHYGGVSARIDTAIEKIRGYLSGKYERLDELEEERLHKPLWAFSPYSTIATPTQSI